jgi:hypothetical protein
MQVDLAAAAESVPFEKLWAAVLQPPSQPVSMPAESVPSEKLWAAGLQPPSQPAVSGLPADREAASPVFVPHSQPSPPPASATCPSIDEDLLVDGQLDDPDWSPQTAADVDMNDFQAAPHAETASHVQMDGPVSDSPSERLGLEAAQLSGDLFPSYVQPQQAHREIGKSPLLLAMQEMKGRAVEHIRYRVIELTELDDYAAATVRELGKIFAQKLKRETWDLIRQLAHLADLHEKKSPGSARHETVSSKFFLDAANRRSLEVTGFKNDGVEADLLRNKFQKVVEKLPRVVYEKLGTLETDRAKFAAVASLINKHSGELVEPDLSIAYWRLVPVGPGFARWDWGEQFWCYEDGWEAPSHFTATEHELHAKQWKPGHGGHLSVNKVMTTDITVIVRASKSKREDLLPAWDHMRFRHVCPCSNSERYAWIRSHSVVSLGEMLMILGEEHTLAEIYSLYRTLRVVVLKRRKDRCSASSGVLGRSSTGSSLSGMAGASVKRELKSSKDLLIEEYSTLMAQSLPDKNDGEGRETVFNKAVQYIHLNLLQDLSPPWIDRQFSQALPGNGVLCRYLKPTFVVWPVAIVEMLLGKVVMEKWSQRCRNVGLHFVALVGRPLYMCSCTLPNGKVCGAIAAMSPLLQQREPNRPFVCKRCANRQPHAHQALPVLRLLRLYAQVKVHDKVVAMRSMPMHILIHAPRTTAAWGVGHELPADALPITIASPTKLQLFHDTGFKYNNMESQNIWVYATHFQHVEG